MLDIRFLAYYLDFGGKVVSKALLSQLFPSLSELLCGGQSFTEELFYSLLLLCSHSLHATAFSSLYDSFAPYLAELQSHFLTLLPFFFDQSWKVEFFCFFSLRLPLLSCISSVFNFSMQPYLIPTVQQSLRHFFPISLLFISIRRNCHLLFPISSQAQCSSFVLYFRLIVMLLKRIEHCLFNGFVSGKVILLFETKLFPQYGRF